MERKKYLEMCREVATLKGGLLAIKENVPDRLRVVYGGIEYYPVKYELGFDNTGKPTHTAVIHDMRANAWIYAELSKVEEKNETADGMQAV